VVTVREQLPQREKKEQLAGTAERDREREQLAGRR
jgi:hypothetical protein